MTTDSLLMTYEDDCRKNVVKYVKVVRNVLTDGTNGPDAREEVDAGARVNRVNDWLCKMMVISTCSYDQVIRASNAAVFSF